MTETYPTDCPCGSRCDGHAIGAPEDPGCEWCGVATTEGEVIDVLEARLKAELARGIMTREEFIAAERSPREEWVGAWKVKQETHR